MGPYPCSQHGRESGHASVSFGSGWAAQELILCCGWKHEKSLPSQHWAIRGTIHFVLSVPFFSITFKKVTVQVNSCPGSSAIQKKEAFLLHVVTAQGQFNFWFIFMSIQMGNRPRQFKITH